MNAAAARGLAAVFASLDDSVPIYVCETSDFLGITGHAFHRGCLGLAVRPAILGLEAFLDRLDETPASSRLLVVLEGVTNADNVGGVFRNAAAFDADGVVLSPTCCDPLYRKAIRTSMAATLRVPFARLGDWPAALVQLRAHGFTIVALTLGAPAEDLDAFTSRGRPAKPALLVGSEGSGLTPAAEALADARVRIPIDSSVDSLNLAVATGIVLHALKQ